MKNIAIFPGSFDPITKGHEALVKRALPLFDKIIIAIGENNSKAAYFSLENRLQWIKKVFEQEPKIEVVSFSGLTIELCKQKSAGFILRGLRTSADFEFERGIGQMNKFMYSSIDTVFLLTEAKFTPITSSIVRDIHRNGGDVSQFVPDAIKIS
ncbi:MAG: pantetheine-phosphate adenylyltransferase [Bacteroidetes bacterium]|nr:pantetheine-phosphate adenylyltransferase [Bacteroidota bacterium]MBU1719011.1 pantetheine-phosphate adenylyltransferase [Bacteroidota bacterium]